MIKKIFFDFNFYPLRANSNNTWHDIIGEMTPNVTQGEGGLKSFEKVFEWPLNLLYKSVVAKLGSKAGNQTLSREFLIWKERGGGGGGERLR